MKVKYFAWMKRTVPFDAKLAGAHEVAFFPPFTGG